MKKINIAEILKDCPQGMELYSPIFGKVYLDKVRRYLAIIVTTDRKQGDSKEEFLYDGRYGMNGECMLFPSKGKTTWEGFVPLCQFKDGDIITDKHGNIAIYKKVHKYFEDPHIDFYCGLVPQTKLFVIKNDKYQNWGKIEYIKFATEKEKEKLFQVIKDNGYRWNTETKTLEKLIEPIFKKGDKVRVKNRVSEPRIARVIKDVCDTFYTLDSVGKINFTDQYNWELVPNKFDITTLKPFDKVLVREDNKKLWRIQFFERLNNVLKDTFVCMGGWRYHQCIPYEGNEHLLNTANDCDDFYKTWE